MRQMTVCDNEEQLDKYLQSISNFGIHSKEDLLTFVKLIDSLPHISFLDGNITWICFSHSISQDTGKETIVVYVATESPSGDWTRVEYILSVTDINKKISEESISIDASNLLKAPIKSLDGKLTLHTETRELHPSGKGTMINWIGEANGIFTRIYYYTGNPKNVKTENLLNNLSVSNIPK